MSALSPKADIAGRRLDVRFVPKADICGAANSSLFDYLVSAGKQRRRNINTKRARGLQIDDKIKFGCLKNWQIRWLDTLENAAGVNADLARIDELFNQPCRDVSPASVISRAKQLAGSRSRTAFHRLSSPLAASVAASFYSPSTRRVCSSRISSAMLVRDSRTSSANGALGRHDRHDSAGNETANGRVAMTIELRRFPRRAAACA